MQKLLNPLTLTYMGDAVLDQHVREYKVLKLQSKPNRLHPRIEQYVSAKSQAQTLEVLIPNGLLKKNPDIVRRGRNAKVIRKLKIQMYKRIKSSGLEAVIGFLYLDHQNERLDALLDTMYKLLTKVVNIVEDIVIVVDTLLKKQLCLVIQ